MLIFLFRHFLHLPPTFLQQSLLKSLNFIKCDKLLSNNETFFPETSDCYACICIFFFIVFPYIFIPSPTPYVPHLCLFSIDLLVLLILLYPNSLNTILLSI